MSTILFHDMIFGPIHSRRLGTSLGVNLLPGYGKWCNFNCIYCECGWNEDGRDDKVLPTKEMVCKTLELRLQELSEERVNIDTITFSGNGEPTLHPDFATIIECTLRLRDKYYKKAKVSVLTNATNLERSEVKNALMKVDNPILKIDGATDEFIRLVDNPQGDYSLERVIKAIESFRGNFILQTMFLRGYVDGKAVDSTDPNLVKGWLDIVRRVKPREIMVYTIDRETPLQTLEKVSVDQMRSIVEPLVKEGYKVQISG